MQESTGLCGMWTVVLKIGPAYCNFGRVMLVSACEATNAGTCCNEWKWSKRARKLGEEVQLDKSAPVMVNLGKACQHTFSCNWDGVLWENCDCMQG